MAAVSCTLSEEQFLCSICLEVFTDPVTAPCGHSFCQFCLNKHWDSSDQYNCPLCKQDFSSRPQMKVNTFMSEMVSQLRNKPQVEETISSKSKSAAPGEVLCDHCPEPRLRALKSCLVCLASYCQSHLQPHLTIPRLKRHQLIQPLPNFEEHICPEHGRLLELFCREHSHFMCMQCKAEDHKDHQVVPLKEEGEVQRATQKEQIKERLLKIEEIRHSVELSQINADTEIQEGLRVFNTLMECVQQSLDKFKQSIVEKHKKNEEEAAQLIEQIQTEISALEQRGAEMEQLWSSGDHLQFVQTFTSVKPAPQLHDWTEESVRVPSCTGRATKAVSELKNTLNTEIEEVLEAEMERVQEFEVDVSLDPNTAHTNLVLSKDLKQVHYSDQENNLPDNSERFSSFFCVLGKQKFSSGKFYFQVQVKGKTEWELGVAKESVDRKDEISQTVRKGFWSLYLGSDEYETSEEPHVVFPVRSSPEKVGVFVDYDEGLVSFYDVGEESLIYSFTDCDFTENILPLFNPCGNDGLNSAPLVLLPTDS
ncbi:E3 ubiquitin-protein ligase TRIM21-like isoform X2 [Eucyclogobius newberryi]|uniref:E3 ubiquitin-protein ligase TRIM21-like isoform X2 n=1 Tax=Eucyclogobius newberryi TaxID=166745 RepID=UPI003B5BF17C